MNGLWPRVVDGWTRFWHSPADLRIVAAFRIAFGALVALHLLLQAEFVTLWWGRSGLVPLGVAQRIVDQDAPSLFWLLPGTDGVAWTVWGLTIVVALLLSVGWHARVQAAVLFVLLVSLHNRNSAILDGEDGIARLLCFFLIFTPLAEVWSLDARRAAAKGIAPRTDDSGWAVRFLQIQTAFLFLVAGLEKMPGADWHQGTALYYTFRLDDLGGRGWVPDLIRDSLWASTVMSWGTLVGEALIPFGAFLRPTRRVCVALAIGFHLALEYLMNLYFFEWFMILGWLTFLRWDEDVAPLLAWGRRTFGRNR